MPNVTVPSGSDPLIHVWTTLAPPLTSAAGGYSSAVYEHSSLSLREFEAARITMARINSAPCASTGAPPGTCRPAGRRPTRCPRPSTRRSGPTTTRT